MTRILESVEALRAECEAARASHRSVGLVPTMGYLHAGHRSLMRAACESCDLVVASIFVNPLQFGVGEDLDDYPRDLNADLEACRAEGVDILFHPEVSEMYPHGAPATTVHVQGLTADLCGVSRPTHFDGVTTVVAKLFAIVGPSRAFFGCKDYQQLLVVRRMARDLDLGVEVVGCPIVREHDGVAMSSRNAYLSAEERAAAPTLYESIRTAAAAIEAGERRTSAVRSLVQSALDREPLVNTDYVEVRDADNLSEIHELSGHVLIAVAAHVGPARLIDNVRVSIAEGGVDVDEGVRLDPTTGGGR